ncbi:MAG: ATP-binding protein [Candidatus Coatesbacteria bacterium]
MFRTRLLWRLYAGYVALIVPTTVALGLLIGWRLDRDARHDLESSLRAKAVLLGDLAEHGGFRGPALEARIRELGSEVATRLTIVRADGVVAADSEEEPARMDNHGTRPEILAAREAGAGVATRWSHTLGVDMMYVAVAIGRKGRLLGYARAALPLTAVRDRLAHVRTLVILGVLIATAGGLMLGFLFARSVTRPLTALTEAAESIAGGGPNREIRTDAPAEIGQLAAAFKRMTGRLEERMEAIRRLETVRQDFVANVSHELKTPVTAIRGLAETLIDDPAMDRETHRGFLAKVRDQAERLSRLVGDLLALSRVESGGAALEREALDFRDPVQDSVRALESAAGAKGIGFEAAISPEPLAVRGDREALRQVADNLLDNAVKYTPAGGRVRVVLRREAGEAVLEVIDTGPGIGPEHLGRIFERFYRVDKARSRELGGTGLGLSIVRHVALAHGGQASVESTVGQGSTFRVRLPIVQA